MLGLEGSELRDIGLQGFGVGVRFEPLLPHRDLASGP